MAPRQELRARGCESGHIATRIFGVFASNWEKRERAVGYVLAV
jgi:hypothetical protein